VPPAPGGGGHGQIRAERHIGRRLHAECWWSAPTSPPGRVRAGRCHHLAPAAAAQLHGDATATVGGDGASLFTAILDRSSPASRSFVLASLRALHLDRAPGRSRPQGKEVRGLNERCRIVAGDLQIGMPSTPWWAMTTRAAGRYRPRSRCVVLPCLVHADILAESGEGAVPGLMDDCTI
jgi:hypothetical protein